MMIQPLILATLVVATLGAGVITPAGLDHYAYGAPWGYSGYSPYHYNPYSAYHIEPALASQTQNIYRTPFNLGQISTYTKAIDTPFSSVRKADVRVSNPGLAVTGLASPYASHVGVAAPVTAPVAKVATTGGLLGVAYSAAPAVSHMAYTNGLGVSYSW